MLGAVVLDLLFLTLAGLCNAYERARLEIVAAAGLACLAAVVGYLAGGVPAVVLKGLFAVAVGLVVGLVVGEGSWALLDLVPRADPDGEVKKRRNGSRARRLLVRLNHAMQWRAARRSDGGQPHFINGRWCYWSSDSQRWVDWHHAAGMSAFARIRLRLVDSDLAECLAPLGWLRRCWRFRD